MNEVLKRRWAIIFVLLGIVCFMIMSFYYLLFDTTKPLEFSNKNIDDVVVEHQQKVNGQIPLFNSAKINKGIDLLVDSKIDKWKDNNNTDLLIDYSYTLHDNLYSFSFKTLYLDENEKISMRDDDFKYYDKEKRTELKIDDLVTRNEEYYNKLKYVIETYLKDTRIENTDWFDNIIFSQDKIYVIMPNGKKDINIPINYIELKKFLNKDYFDIKGEYEPLAEKTVEPKKEEPKKEEPKKEEPKKETTKKETQPKKQTKKVTPKEELKSSNDGSSNKIVPVVRDAKYFQGKKLICFTFDDGPAGKYTTKLLDALKARNYKVSFFMVGNRVKNNANLVRRMKAEGHSIGQHSYSHANLKKLSQSDPNKAKNEIYLANDAIKAVIGENPRYIRPPYGAYNAQVLTYADMVFVNWSIDPLDWKYRNANTVYNNIIKKAYDGAIVLVHDIHPTSVDGAIMAMDYLASKGYAIVSIDEMASLRGINLQTHHLYNHFKK